MNFIERVMRVMTQLNIGAALGLAAWVLWSGWQVVTGQITPALRRAEVQAPMRLASAGEPPPLRLVPVHAAGEAVAPCDAAVPTPQPTDTAAAGADL